MGSGDEGYLKGFQGGKSHSTSVIVLDTKAVPVILSKSNLYCIVPLCEAQF